MKELILTQEAYIVTEQSGDEDIAYYEATAVDDRGVTYIIRWVTANSDDEEYYDDYWYGLDEGEVPYWGEYIVLKDGVEMGNERQYVVYTTRGYRL